MASAFQNRLVGTVVLVAAAVLVLPEFLDGKKATLEEQFATIPLRPTVDVAPVTSAPAPVNESQPAAEPEQTASWQIEQAPSEPTQSDTPKRNDDVKKSQTAQVAPVKAGWSLRLGSFGNVDNVNRLVAKLRQGKYPAYTIPKTPKAGQLTAVMVGPEIDKKRLEKFKAEIAKKENLKGTIIPYDPLAR